MIRRKMFLRHMAKADRYRELAADCGLLNDVWAYSAFIDLAEAHEARAVRWLPRHLRSNR